MAESLGSPVWRKLYLTVFTLALLCGLGGVGFVLSMERPVVHEQHPGEEYFIDSGGQLRSIKDEQVLEAAALDWEPISREQLALLDREALAGFRRDRLFIAFYGFIPLIVLVALNRWWRWLRKPEQCAGSL